MRPDTQLDYAIFQLTPSRDRCELYVVAQGQTYKLASGLLNPFLAHMRTAEEQIAQGGQSIRLEPPDPRSAGWFTKGTVERFVRFVSTPEVLERVSTIEMELLEVAEAIRTQASDALEETQTAEDHTSTKLSPSSGGSPQVASNLDQIAKAQESIDDSKPGLEENTKRWLLRALDARHMMLQKEQEMAFGRAIAAGFTFRHVGDLVLFAERFGANRLREACIKFMTFCQKRKESGTWIEDGDPATGENQLPFMGGANANAIKCVRPKEYPEAWSDILSRDGKSLELRRASFPIEGTLPTVVNGVENITREGLIDGERWQAMARMGYPPPLMWPVNRQVSAYGMNQLPLDHMHSGGLGNPEYRKDLGPGGIPDMERGPAWQGQSQYFQGNPLHRAMPPTVGFPMHPQLGLAYPQSFDNLCMHPTYTENNKWQMHAATAAPPQYYAGNERDNRARLIVNENEMNADPFHKEVAAPSTDSAPTQRDMHEGSTTQLSDETMDRKEDINLTIPSACSKELASDKPVEVLDDKEEMSNVSQTSIDSQMNKDNQESSHETGEEPIAEAVRRFPRRGSSPSRRSVSPMRKVQIARSGFRRSGSFTKRNNYNVQDEHSVVDDAVESSEDETEGNEDAVKISEATQDKTEPFRVRVQDVIGLFESKKEDNSDVRKQFVRKESRRLSLKNPVLSRWGENGGQTERQLSLPLENDASIEEISKSETQQATGVKKDALNGGGSKLVEGIADGLHEQGKLLQEAADSEVIETSNVSVDKCDSSSLNAAPDSTTGSQCLEQSLDDSFITFEPHLEVDTFHEQKLDEDSGHSDDSGQIQGKSTLKDDDKVKTFGNGLHDTDAKEKTGIKTSEKEVKAKALQEMLERRKAAAVKSSKPTPLVAIAQSRAEKLRAYKAGLQQSKKEKEEKERKRIEDLKNQRRERMAARNISSAETTVKKIVQTPSPSGNRSSPTAFHKVSSTTTTTTTTTTSTGPQIPMGGAATLSPTSVAKTKISGGKKPSRVPAKASENILSQSVPSFTDLKKENLKTSPTVRASTGSQRFAQLKKPVKDADAASPLKANNAEEKKRSFSSATRKGIPPARDTKGESLPSQKVAKISPSAIKPQKKKSSEKASATENGKVSDEVKTIDISSAAGPVVEEETKKDESKGIYVELTEADIPAVEVDVPIEDLESTCTKVADLPSELEVTSTCPTIELVMSSESPDHIKDSKEVFYVQEPSLKGNIMSNSDGNQLESSTVSEAHDVPVAHVPSTNGSPFTENLKSVNMEESPAIVDDLPSEQLPEQSDPHAFAIVDTPSKSLPRLHEAIQQAHSPEISLGTSKLKKKQGDNGSQKSSKDHQAKGLKRLLFLGRKSSRNNAQNVEGHEDIGDLQVNTTKHSKNGSDVVTNSSSGRSNLKSQGDEVTRGSSSKGSRSFFSLALRGKGEGR